MVIEACRAVLTDRCRLMCKQRGRQHTQARSSGHHNSGVDLSNGKVRAKGLVMQATSYLNRNRGYLLGRGGD